MSSISRRPGSKQTRFLERTSDPASALNEAKVYAKDVAGSTELFARSSNGSVHQITPGRASALVQMASASVPEGTSSQELTLGRVTYAGSLVGLSVHMEDARTAGTVTVNVKVNAVTKLTALIDAANTESAFDTETSGVHTLAQGDELTIEIVGDSAYLHAGTGDTVAVFNITTNDALTAAASSLDDLVNGAAGRWNGDARDVNFDGVGLPASVSQLFTDSGNPPDAHSSFAGGNANLAINTSDYPNQCAVQPPGDSVTQFFSITPTINTNDWYEFKFSLSMAKLGLALDNGYIHFRLDDTAGSNFIDFILRSDGTAGGTWELLMRHNRGGVNQFDVQVDTFDPEKPFPLQYFALGKQGDFVNMYTATASRSWQFFQRADHTGGGAFNRFLVGFRNGGSLITSGNLTGNWHWLRFRNTTGMPT